MNTMRTETGYQLDNIQVDAKPFSKLPTQQARTLLFVAKGLPQKQIAAEMGVSLAAVKQHCSNLGYKFNTYNMRETVHAAIAKGVLRYALCAVLCVITSLNTDAKNNYRTARNRTTRVSRVRNIKSQWA